MYTGPSLLYFQGKLTAHCQLSLTTMGNVSRERLGRWVAGAGEGEWKQSLAGAGIGGEFLYAGAKERGGGSEDLKLEEGFAELERRKEERIASGREMAN